jgi:DNA-binding transcriptional LysR family regulator
MFSGLFSESGLSIDRLRALVEVGAAGSIARATGSDPVRQSQYSRQIKELEDFFRTGLVERHGKGIRLTVPGRELARISRFFLMGLSNFQRGRLAEGQTYRLGAPPTFAQVFLAPALAAQRAGDGRVRFALESAGEEDLERRLHDLTLDYGITTRESLSRPLQIHPLGKWRVVLWLPRRLCQSPARALREVTAGRLELAWAAGELPLDAFPELRNYDPVFTCRDFLEARSLLETGTVAAFLPDFLPPPGPMNRLLRLETPWTGNRSFAYGLAWNPRLLRLNPHSRRRRDALASVLARKLDSR